ncbi:MULTISPECIES: class A beta-lactamase [unclassified Rhizobium]|uniref:class A beta-lactamase n=1 Tax=unclassified Rhizobium TaxID=2613769 RepID=UPI000EAA4D91|nr:MULTISPECIES: class A beta-lactamase [unclassified Rhizobium]AYG69011.1 class A beta-lactamase [Rhizobium sp. CCGE531]AYG75389.1 class A beta-lactamase [Rhizobium sp. CCGE532]
MTILLSRRQSLAGGLLALPVLAGLSAVGRTADDNSGDAQLAVLESKHPGRICVGILDMASGKRIEHRAGERILMCSTFKALAAALVLTRVDKGEEKLDRRIRYSEGDIIGGSPATKLHVGDGMTVAELCAAAVTLSDNTAANLLLASFGGPKALTAFCRSLGDEMTRLDRIEPALNYHDTPDDQRDTTTAIAMLENLRRLLFTDVLSAASRSQLAAWLITNKTGDARLRAGVPKDWLVGDKTGTNGDRAGNANDIAVLWPSNRAPILVTAYCEIPSIAANERNAIIAEIGRIAAAI